MRIFITGIAGFLGSHLAKNLIKLGHKISGNDNLILGEKENLTKKDREKALIRKVLSYFDKDNFNVIYREYKFVYKNWLIDLDMDVVVYLDYIDNYHVPTKIIYDGFWKVLFFKKEKADFSLNLYNYHIR